jgi:hypothetical protein
MPETPQAFAERLGIPIQLVEYKRTYGQLFPAEHPLSPIMLRLMIIRDDLSFEIDGLILKEEDDHERVWRNDVPPVHGRRPSVRMARGRGPGDVRREARSTGDPRSADGGRAGERDRWPAPGVLERTA